MKRRSFLALLATLPFFRWLIPKKRKLNFDPVNTTKVSDVLPELLGFYRNCSFSTTCVIGYDPAIPGTDKSYFTISGTDVNGNFITETIELPPTGCTVVSKHAYRELCAPGDADALFS